jgi:hypothetical protein
MDRYYGSASVVVPADRGRIETMGRFVRELASGIADAADADQWVVVVEGVEETGHRALQDLVPGWWLRALDDGRLATHRVVLPLRSGVRDLGVVELESWKPGGFREEDLLATRRAAHSAGRLLDVLIPEMGPSFPRPHDWVSRPRLAPVHEGGT